MIPCNVHAVWWGDEGLEKREEEACDDSEAEYLHCYIFCINQTRFDYTNTLHTLFKCIGIFLRSYCVFSRRHIHKFPASDKWLLRFIFTRTMKSTFEKVLLLIFVSFLVISSLEDNINTSSRTARNQITWWHRVTSQKNEHLLSDTSLTVHHEFTLY